MRGTQIYKGQRFEILRIWFLLSGREGCKDSIEDQKTGILIESKNVSDLIDALKLLIENPALRKEMGQNGIQRIKDLYDRNKIWDSLLEEYERMIKAVKT